MGEDGAFSKELNESITNFCSFMRKNTSLVHLDMRQSGLTPPIIRMLVYAVADSTSLMSVHLCGNPGLSRELI